MKGLTLLFILALGVGVRAQNKLQTPLREQSVIITREGYYPDRITAYAGETVRFFITTTLNEPSCFIVKGKEAFVSAKKGRLSETEAYFSEAGEHTIYCPTHKFKGKIIVLDNEQATTRKRSIASDQKSTDTWLPKEY